MRVRKWKKNVQLDFLTQISNVALIERSIQYYSSVEKRDQAESTRLWSLAVSQTFIKFSRSLLSEFSCIARLIKALSCVVCGSIMVWILCKSLLRGELPSRCWRHSLSHREENPEIRKWLFISLTHVIRPWGTEHGIVDQGWTFFLIICGLSTVAVANQKLFVDAHLKIQSGRDVDVRKNLCKNGQQQQLRKGQRTRRLENWKCFIVWFYVLKFPGCCCWQHIECWSWNNQRPRLDSRSLSFIGIVF